MKLLSVSADSKTVKGEKRGYLTGILYLMPDLEICKNGEKAGCIGAHGARNCLVDAGRAAIFSAINEARARKTSEFKADKNAFILQLEKDISALIRKADRENLTPVVRLNGTSDLNWVKIFLPNGKTLFETFPGVQFMDYTKLPRISPFANYHLTASYSGREEYAPTVRAALRRGLNLAVVFEGTPPTEFLGRPVVDGDKDDLRFLDPTGVIVALKAKGKAAKNDTTGFVVRRDLIASVA